MQVFMNFPQKTAPLHQIPIALVKKETYDTDSFEITNCDAEKSNV